MVIGLSFAALIFSRVEAWLGDTVLVVEQPLGLVVEKGDSLTRVARRLETQGVIDSAYQLRWFARLRGGGDRILAGEYQLLPGQTVAETLAALTNGDMVRRQVTIIEGETFGQLLGKIYQAPGLVLTTKGLGRAEIMRQLGSAGQAAEGNFFPDTYFYSTGISDLQLLKKMHQTMQSHLQKAWRGRAEKLAIDSPQAALILASIIEKESGTQSERARISGVFHRRLAMGMRLQADSTIIYGLGAEFDGDIRRRDLRRDTPYNSYLHHGLPPTAIALPGLASIEAAVHPNLEDDAIYFVARGDGSHQFSSTLAEHNRAVRRYQLGIQ
jgi:UPF0755 protein